MSSVVERLLQIGSAIQKTHVVEVRSDALDQQIGLTFDPGPGDRLGFTYRGLGTAGDLFLVSEVTPGARIQVDQSDLADLESLVVAAATGTADVVIRRVVGKSFATEVRFSHKIWHFPALPVLHVLPRQVHRFEPWALRSSGHGQAQSGRSV